ncbi:hypothetical protein CALCODRAFT_53161 [Calocera cornea HHB12733]|uniref:Uncharacterized protein n=1 Tax=Calocera cornea HHB12733 TaxID=1353952 RepID=A0A165DRE7_9BASI|nr:hypothetical protein CALCODRAFT_53161 [Calocera cornea HHB12733]
MVRVRVRGVVRRREERWRWERVYRAAACLAAAAGRSSVRVAGSRKPAGRPPSLIPGPSSIIHVYHLSYVLSCQLLSLQLPTGVIAYMRLLTVNSRSRASG